MVIPSVKVIKEWYDKSFLKQTNKQKNMSKGKRNHVFGVMWEVLIDSPLFPKALPQHTHPHVWFGSDFAPDALPNATFSFIQAVGVH